MHTVILVHRDRLKTRLSICIPSIVAFSFFSFSHPWYRQLVVRCTSDLIILRPASAFILLRSVERTRVYAQTSKRNIAPLLIKTTIRFLRFLNPRARGMARGSGKPVGGSVPAVSSRQAEIRARRRERFSIFLSFTTSNASSSQVLQYAVFSDNAQFQLVIR